MAWGDDNIDDVVHIDVTSNCEVMLQTMSTVIHLMSVVSRGQSSTGVDAAGQSGV